MDLILSIAGGLVIGLLYQSSAGTSVLFIVPFLILIFDSTLYQAIVGATVAAFAINTITLVEVMRRKLICWKTAGYFGLSSSCVAFFTAKANPSFPNSVQWFALGVMAALAAIFIFKSRGQNAPVVKQKNVEPHLAGVVGMAIGTLTGLSGMSCGFFLEPWLRKISAVQEEKILGTSSVVIGLSLLSTLMGFDQSHFLSNQVLMPLAGTAAAGSYTLSRISPHTTLTKKGLWYSGVLIVLSLWFFYSCGLFFPASNSGQVSIVLRSVRY